MVKMTQEMQDYVGKELSFLATADKDANPQVGPKGSLHVYDEEHLIYFEHTFRQAFANLQFSGKAAVATVNREAQKGFRFEGTAHIHEGDELANEILGKTKIFDAYDRAAVVIIDIERIYKLDNNLEAGIQLA